MSETDYISPIDFFVPEQELTEEEKKSGYPCHPFALIFHILFKIAAIVTYLFGGIFASVFKSNAMASIICCTIFIAFDFWTTKNVSGRLLAGLRWWNDVKPDGTNHWVFESLEDKTLINPAESKVFWLFLFVVPIFWVIFTIKNIFSFPKWEWLAPCLLATILQCSNIVGYVKCARSMYFLLLQCYIDIYNLYL